MDDYWGVLNGLAKGFISSGKNFPVEAWSMSSKGI
jgi:hypothetical protein